MNRINVDGTHALMMAAMDAGVTRMVYTSSVATLGIRPKGERYTAVVFTPSNNLLVWI